MALASPTVADLATFTGRESNTFGDFASEALAQATLLLYLSTDLTGYPEDPDLAMLAKYGILDMADKIYLSQPYKTATISPFQSETIGSYSYSKMTQAVKKGDATGVAWFDLAVSKLKGGGSGVGASGSIQGMEFDGLESDGNGGYRIMGASGNHNQGRRSWDSDVLPTDDIIHHHQIL
jgi:hypothetical protein